MFQTKFVQKIKTHVLCSTAFSRKSCHVWDNEEKYGRSWQATDDSKTWCMDFACWITKATDTQIIASPWQQWLHEHPSVLSFTYTAWLAHLSTPFLHLLHLDCLTAFSGIYVPSVVYTCLLWYICIFTNILDIKAWPSFVFHLAVQHTKFPRSTTSHSVEVG